MGDTQFMLQVPGSRQQQKFLGVELSGSCSCSFQQMQISSSAGNIPNTEVLSPQIACWPPALACPLVLELAAGHNADLNAHLIAISAGHIR
jgi:hypothetical protein